MTSKYLIPLLTSFIAACFLTPAWTQEITASEITFACEENNGNPITVARNQEGQTETVFYWKEETLAGKTRFTIQELCNSVSDKLNRSTQDYLTKMDDFYAFDLHASEEAGFPFICLTVDYGCNLALFALSASSETKQDIAFETLEAIINPNIIDYKKDRCRYRDCFSSVLFTITVNLFQTKQIKKS